MDYTLLPFTFLIFSSLHLLTCTGQDRIPTGTSLSGNDTIISAGENFALGLFNPPNSTKSYLAIWYNKISDRTIAWVANRGKPVMDSGGVVTVTGNGNLVVLDGNGKVVWSTNLTATDQNRTAVLLDNGNLVLMEGNNSTVWKSFDYPTATMLPGMRFYLNLKTNESIRTVSWKDEVDPTPGPFSAGIDPHTPRQLQVLRGSNPFWRENVWFKELSAAKPEADRNYFVYLSTLANDDEVYYTFSVSDNSIFVRYFLSKAGRLELQSWRDDTQKWTVSWASQMNKCDLYGRCGPFSSCDYNSTESVCRCLYGFVPRIREEWDSGNWSGGCVMRKVLECGVGDGFLQLRRMKLPDFSVSVGNISVSDCEGVCRQNCSCAAYAYTNISGWRASNCLIWVGNLTDLVSNYGKLDLFVRLDSSELGTNVTNGTIHDSSNKRPWLVILISVAAALIFLGAFGYLLWRRYKKPGMRRNDHANEMNGPDGLANGENISDLPLFSFHSIVAATGNFCTANKLGEGGFGPVYKGVLPGGQEIAVKRLSKSSGQGLEEFKNEVKLIAKLQHRNLVRLLGWCIHEEEKILMYEYMPNKSLDKFLFDPIQESPIDWGTRFRIMEGISQGLLYLHRHSRLKIIHRDLKTSNILLDGEMNPKISDFGLARIVEGNQSNVNTKRVAGTYGYMSPEYALDGIFSEKSDVFSFGVLLLEIVSGKRNTGFYPYKESLNLLGYAWQLWEEGRGLALVDPLISDLCVPHEVMKCIHVGLLCVQEDPNDRPKMSSVVFMLGSETATPPTPKQPAFSTMKNRNVVDPASDASANFSVNWA
ncbi:G-type lectin S-receptor-like serine/threonine-protein kinase At1g11330 isoform X2 [Magnolia sinica]|uniref:G-type lectin S-receptor-like serine/threonine-protein kinase At1g11330 isoform X2 n=1 Tax=Magnolia sinica TaxID=86752 RepID=UPI002659A3A0|nr:G-type lectin S-receptor-like serine/threonine-protein kinase At1g11330 isoform X2 [Magnolia sinica]